MVDCRLLYTKSGWSAGLKLSNTTSHVETCSSSKWTLRVLVSDDIRETDGLVVCNAPAKLCLEPGFESKPEFALSKGKGTMDLVFDDSFTLCSKARRRILLFFDRTGSSLLLVQDCFFCLCLISGLGTPSKNVYLLPWSPCTWSSQSLSTSVTMEVSLAKLKPSLQNSDSLRFRCFLKTFAQFWLAVSVLVPFSEDELNTDTFDRWLKWLTFRSSNRMLSSIVPRLVLPCATFFSGRKRMM